MTINVSKTGMDLLCSANANRWSSFWMFTVGLADLSIGQAAIALVVWPYYLGTWIGGVLP